MHCLITGAADGIGRALALRFAQAEYDITGLDVDAERAAHTQAEIVALGGQATFVQTDLTSAAEIGQRINQLKDGPPIDVLINNAGISAVGQFSQIALASQTKVMQLNLLAPMVLTGGLLREKLLSRPSSLVFVSSMSYFTGYPGAAVYGASKDGLASYARSLAVSLAGQQAHVLTVYPGPTRTAHARRYSPDNRREHRRMPPETLADLIFKAVQNRQRYLIPAVSNRILAMVGHYWPALAEFAMKKAIFEKLPAQSLE